MSNIYVSQHAELSDIIGNKHNLDEIRTYLQDMDIVILPEYYGTQMSFSMDLVNVIKDLREKGLKIGIVEEGSDIRESKFEDIIIQLGIFGAKAVIEVILKIVGQHIYDNYVKDHKGNTPHTKVTYYREDKKKLEKYEGTAGEVADALRNFKNDPN